MATNIVGSVNLSYGSHSHDESFTNTTATLTDANPFNEYAAGSGRALVDVGSTPQGDLIKKGTIDGAEGLLLIKNENNIGSLLVSMDGGNNWDISIPAKVANLISVGPDHDAHVKIPDSQDNVSQADVASVSSDGSIVFAGTTVSGSIVPGTAIMTKHSGLFFPDDLIVEIDSATTGTVFELDGKTKKDLTGAGTLGYTSSTDVNLVYFARYRYTLTEA